MIDLHVHSTASDGSDPPARVAELAAAAGCRAFALTDHDGQEGVNEARARSEELGIELVAGCELSCSAEGVALHLLVYFLQPGEGPLQDRLEGLRRVRDDRNRRLVERLGELGLPVTLAEVEEEAGGGAVGRPHVAAVLARKGLVSTIQEAFDLWLAKGRPGYVERVRLSALEAIALARDSGAVPVVAHPLSMRLGPPALESAVAELADAGLAGLEAIYGRYAPEERQGLAALAARHDLVVTGGSDYHGSYKPDLSIGTGTGDLDVPDSVLDDLAARQE